jgi:single-stranded DNA-binding protein
LVVVLGEIKYSKYTNQKGEDRDVTSIMAGNIQLASKKLEGNAKQDDNDLPSDF